MEQRKERRSRQLPINKKKKKKKDKKVEAMNSYSESEQATDANRPPHPTHEICARTQNSASTTNGLLCHGQQINAL